MPNWERQTKVDLSEPEKKHLELLCAMSGVSLTEYIRRAIHEQAKKDWPNLLESVAVKPYLILLQAPAVQEVLQEEMGRILYETAIMTMKQCGIPPNKYQETWDWLLQQKEFEQKIRAAVLSGMFRIMSRALTNAGMLPNSAEIEKMVKAIEWSLPRFLDVRAKGKGPKPKPGKRGAHRWSYEPGENPPPRTLPD